MRGREGLIIIAGIGVSDLLAHLLPTNRGYPTAPVLLRALRTPATLLDHPTPVAPLASRGLRGAATNRFLRKSGTWRAGTKGVDRSGTS